METLDLFHWQKVLQLIHAAFREVWLTEETMWQAVVLIPKGGGDHYSIGLVEVVWKVGTVILNRRLTISIGFHGVLHGLRAGCGMGTASLEAKLIQQLTSMR